jgi:signal transduction histidine kinase
MGRPRPTTFRFPAPRLPAAAAYALAIALPSLAMVGNVSMRSLLDDVPFILFFLAVAVVSAVGGWVPGTISVCLSAALGYEFLHTSPWVHHQAAARDGALVFVPVGLVCAGLGALFRAAFLEREDAIAALRQSEAREKARAAELAAAVQARDEFLSAASHELKTPLTSIHLHMQMLARMRAREGGIWDSEVSGKLSAVERQFRRMTKLVNNLLEVSRLTDGKRPVVLEEVDLVTVAREVVERFSAEGELCGSQVSLHAPQPVCGRWDPERIDQILTNLVSNALRYGLGHPIEVVVGYHGDTASIVVADHGIGIPADEQDSIFDRFERGRTTREAGGLGIGLWIVREAVDSLAGKVSVVSTVGAGATFTVLLPLKIEETSTPGGDRSCGGEGDARGATSVHAGAIRP